MRPVSGSGAAAQHVRSIGVRADLPVKDHCARIWFVVAAVILLAAAAVAWFHLRRRRDSNTAVTAADPAAGTT